MKALSFQYRCAGELVIFCHQCFLAFFPVWVQFNAINRTDNFTLRFIMMSDALGARAWINQVDGLSHRNGIIGTLRFADVTINAFVGNAQSHGRVAALK